MNLTENKHLNTFRTYNNLPSKSSILHDIHKRILGVDSWNKIKNEVQTTSKRSFIRLQKNFEKDLLLNIKHLELGNKSLSEAKRSAYLIFLKYYKQAYMLGFKSSGGGISQGLNNFSRLTANPLIQNNERVWSQTAAKSENRFMSLYLDLIKKGSKVKDRVSMYKNTLEGQYDSGRVVGSPNNSLVHWITQEKFSQCNFCQYMADNSPWPKEKLITTPKSGFCHCLSNCRCVLKISTTDVDTYRKLSLSLPNKERLTSLLIKLV